MANFTQALDYIEQYIELTKPLLTEGQETFPGVEGKLEYCINRIKESDDYTGPKVVSQ
jgi:hypothetical protein